jgi:hypothetical protein
MFRFLNCFPLALGKVVRKFPKLQFLLLKFRLFISLNNLDRENFIFITFKHFEDDLMDED